ncbi:MAG: hypothetical protein II933_04195 [Candidatus Methanomethylophilaceae archaeon]|nr:hypothetical protein [Candidatus Methanomethylophilaceae archaeon]
MTNMQPMKAITVARTFLLVILSPNRKNANTRTKYGLVISSTAATSSGSVSCAWNTQTLDATLKKPNRANIQRSLSLTLNAERSTARSIRKNAKAVTPSRQKHISIGPRPAFSRSFEKRLRSPARIAAMKTIVTGAAFRLTVPRIGLLI